MAGKSSVSVLQEYCVKNHISLPIYDFIERIEESKFDCLCKLSETQATGTGSSKREAKNLSAAKMLEILKVSASDTIEIEEQESSVDMISKLNVFCKKNKFSMPILEIVQQTGTSNAPQFFAMCTVDKFIRYSVSERKKEAKKKAALDMYNVLVNEIKTLNDKNELDIAISKMEEVKCDEVVTRKKFKRFSEACGGDYGANMSLSNRHMYFINQCPKLKNSAKLILDKNYDNLQIQAMELFNNFKFKPSIEYLNAVNSSERFVVIRVNSEYNFVLAGLESNVWKYSIQFFRNMLL